MLFSIQILFINHIILDNNNSVIASKDKNYSELINEIGSIYTLGKQKAYSQVNSTLVETYWKIGKSIIEFEQAGNIKPEYGKKILDELSRDLKLKYGKGFGRHNVFNMRK